MKTTKIWLYETCSFKELSRKSKKVALENVREKMVKELPKLLSPSKEFVEMRASIYEFLESGKIYKEKEVYKR